MKPGRLAYLGRHSRMNGRAMGRFKCDCGKIVIANETNVKMGRTQSCGCLISHAKTVHGETKRKDGKSSRSPEYAAHKRMIERCHGPNRGKFPAYGGRGSVVCDRWRNGETGKTGFECFLEDVGRRPSAAHLLKRKDAEGNFSPDNCHWVAR